MKIVVQPDKRCPRCENLMKGYGETGTQDLYHCEICGKMEFFRRQERRGSARKKAIDDPIEVVACSGEISVCCCGHADGVHKFDDPFEGTWTYCTHPYCRCGSIGR